MQHLFVWIILGIVCLGSSVLAGLFGYRAFDANTVGGILALVGLWTLAAVGLAGAAAVVAHIVNIRHRIQEIPAQLRELVHALSAPGINDARHHEIDGAIARVSDELARLTGHGPHVAMAHRHMDVPGGVVHIPLTGGYH